ncbi:MAG: MBL fold metallo-hydrolase [Anaerolineae bacterium]|nr:MBL fold metallo-hydrolase [Anaerolineae bacterium]
MREIFPGLYEVMPSKPTPSKYRSFFVERPGWNLLVPCFSNSSTIHTSFDEIEQRGGLKAQLLGDSHFRTAHCDEVAERFGAPLYCSEVEAPDVTRKVKQVVTFPFKRHWLNEDIEVIPTPGHRPGGVCYLLHLGERRILLAGDFVWHDGTRWIPTASSAGVAAYRNSLNLLAQLDFDVLIINGMLSNPIFSIEFMSDSLAEFIAEMIRQLGD